MDGDIKKLQHGMTEAHQQIYSSLVKGEPTNKRYELETVKIQSNKEVGNNLRDVYSKVICDLLNEHGLGEKAAKLALGFRFMTKGIGFKTSNPEATGGGGVFSPNELQESLMMEYRDWSKRVIAKLGYLKFDATTDIIVRNQTLEYVGLRLKTRNEATKEVIIACLRQ